MKQLFDELDRFGNVIASGIYLVPGMRLAEGHEWVLHVPSLENIKQDKKSEIENRRNLECFKPVSALEHLWQADSRSQSLLSQAILLADTGSAPVPPTWRTLDNIDVSVTLADLKAIASAVAEQTQLAYQTSWVLKALVDSAKTSEEVSRINWGTYGS